MLKVNYLKKFTLIDQVGNSMNKQKIENELKKGISLHQKGILSDAKNIYQSVISRDSKNFEAIHHLGIIEYQNKNYQASIDLIKKALILRPNYAEAYSNLALSYKELGHHDLALASLSSAIRIKPKNSQAFYNRGNIKRDQADYISAIKDYTKSIEADPKNFVAYFNRGLCNDQTGNIKNAINDYQNVIQLNPEYEPVYTNLLTIQMREGLKKESFTTLYKMIEINDKNCYAYICLAGLFKELGQIDNAINCLVKVKNIDSEYEFVDGLILHYKMFASNWDHYYESITKLKKDLSSSKPVAVSFIALTLIDDPQIQLNAAKNYSKRFTGIEKIAPKKSGKNRKIRIGYFSSDFFNHATCILIAELFELHNRDEFEVYGFSFGPNIQDNMSARIRESFDHFHEVRDLIDKDIAALSIECQIDIAIDLKGYTKDSRAGIFKFQPAPVVVNYLGYPGTMANPNVNYIIADETLIPIESQKFYSEKIAYMPHSYQINDSKRKIADYSFTREEVGLPKRGFIFCCFNNIYKFNPEVFDSWANILRKVEGSVLWLLEENELSTANLRIEAKKRGISSDRLVFAKRLDNSHHLARSQLADLFLDTWPCNAHTTASDALWAGLPIVTLIGESFASRVCASLLSAVGLSELIAENVHDYESLAIQLALNEEKLDQIKKGLVNQKYSFPLFDTQQYVKDLEKLYLKMHNNYIQGLTPESLYI
jgi:predicted O-linked N-acetylglucosamine transferase (SPINDLY family)